MKFFMLLHTAERPKRSFSCFCTLQKGKKRIFHATEHFGKAKNEFFTLLNISGELKQILKDCGKVPPYNYQT